MRKTPVQFVEQCALYLIGSAINLRIRLEELRLEHVVISNDMVSMIYGASDEADPLRVVLELVLTDVVGYLNGPVLSFAGFEKNAFLVDVINFFERLKTSLDFKEGLTLVRSVLSRHPLNRKALFVLALVAVSFGYELEILQYENELNSKSGYVMGEEELEEVDPF